MQNSSFKYDVFLSHSSKDKPIVRELANQLREDGLEVWLDEWIIQPGDPISIKIEEGLQHSRILILCMSQNAFNSEWVSLERHTMLFRDPSNKERRFIPLLLADCEIPLLLKQYAYLDWRDKSKTAYQKLLDSLAIAESENMEGDKENYLIKTFATQNGSIRNLAINSNGDEIISGSDSVDNNIKIWDLKTGNNIATLKGHTKAVFALALISNKKLLVSGSHDNTIKVWDLNTKKLLTTLKGHTDGVYSLAVSPDGNKIVSGSNDNTIKVWDLKSNKKTITFSDHSATVYTLKISYDGKKIISGSLDGSIKIWDLNTKKLLTTLAGHTNGVLSLALSPDGKKIISGGKDNTIKIWDIETGKNLSILEGHNNSVHVLALSPNGAKIISGSWDTNIKIWDIKTGKNLATLKSHSTSVYSLAVSPDGNKIISGSSDNRIKVWNGISLLDKNFSTDIQYTNAKIALVGETGVGKTGLALRLAKNDWYATESTHGMNIWQMDLPNINDLVIDKEVWLWDFAGQADYRLIHQLYMEQISLAMMVIDPQKEDPLEPLAHWENALEKAGSSNTNKLLVAARCDRGGINISKAKLKEYCENKVYLACYSTDAKTGKGCVELKSAISEAIPWNDLGWTTTSLLFKKLKDAIIKLKKKDNILLPFDTLKQHMQLELQGSPVSTEEIRAVVGLLEGQGVVKVLEFGDLVLLQPEQINNYASAIIKIVRNNTEEIGHINKDNVLEANIDFGDLDRVESIKEKNILRSIVQTFINRNICLQEETNDGTQLVFPSYFKVERPELVEAPNIFVTYSFQGVFDEIYATLIVRLIHTNDFEKDKFWKYAADFQTHTEKRLGLQMIKNQNHAELRIYFETVIPDDTKISFIKYIHEHLKKHAKDVSRIRSYVCPECNQLVEKNRVIKRLTLGKRDIICDNCDSKFTFDDIIEKKFGSDKFARKVVEMDSLAEFNIDNESKELILVGHAFTTVASAGHIFRITSNSDWGVDGEIEFKNAEGNASGKKVYVQLKSGGSYLKTRKHDEKEIFQIKNERLIDYWKSHNYPVMLVIGDANEKIRWMNISNLLETQTKKTKSIEFSGEDFTSLNIDNLRKILYPNI